MMQNEFVQKMMQYWVQLQPREQTLVAIGGAVLLLALIYGVVWQPVADKVTRLEQSVKDQQDLVQWMTGAAQDLERMKRGQMPAGRAGQGQSLLAIVDSTSKMARIEQSVKRVEPDSQNKVRVWLENVAFDEMAVWLTSLTRNYGVIIESASIDKEAVSGRVSARFVFQESV